MSATHETQPDARLNPYLDLIRRFPLRHLTSDVDLTDANALLQELISRPLLDVEQDHLDVLGDLIERHGSATIDMGDPSASVILRTLMAEHDDSQADLARELGVAVSTVNEVLSGKRNFTRKQVGIICKPFRLRRDAFQFDRED